ncbi:hypothetical protein IQ250_16000 [Pseudanabaenaceae cyanobacterium LEGE 13415]|nr:hypothetical protein [Pseudanabaenaceae cyanobacterium LEGE 13415]
MDELTTEQWNVAYKIAEALNREGVKVNELQKAIAYLRSFNPNEGAKFFTYLQVLEREGYRVGHSKETPRYYRTLNQVCRQHLSGDVPKMLQVLGWAARLLHYYSSGGLVAEVATSAIAAETVEVGQVLDATIEKKEGMEVTYRVAGVKRSNTERKRHQDLQVGAAVKVEVVSLKEDGTIKKIRLWEG